MSFQRLIMLGAFPPPVHGMAAVNASVREELRKIGCKPLIIDIAAPNLSRSILSRLRRVPSVLLGLTRLAFMRRLHGAMLYMSVSGGNGQVYDILFVLLARLRGMRIFLHHHSFAYIDKPQWITGQLVRLAGSNAVHITQSPRMADGLKLSYNAKRTVPISNAVFFLATSTTFTMRSKVKSIGFISNISAEKGVFEFLDLCAAADKKGLSVKALLAGPFQDIETENAVLKRLKILPNVEYVGALYNDAKEAYFASIDVLVFPTRYNNETEGIVNHEAMSRGIPVIAYGRGCIPEIVYDDCGKVIDPTEKFVPTALAQLEAWIDNPESFQSASKTAAQRFSETYEKNQKRWQALLDELTGKTIK